MKKSKSTTIDRENKILSLLKKHTHVTRTIMCDFCDCSPKSAQRSIEKLRNNGWMIENSHQGYSLTQGSPPTLEEKFRLLMLGGCTIDRSVGLIIADDLGKPFSDEDSKAISKSCDALAKNYSNQLIETFITLAKNIAGEEAVTFNYLGTEQKDLTKQQVFPLQLKRKNSKWSLLSLDLKSHSPNEHNLCSIKELTTLTKKWEKPPSEVIESALEAARLEIPSKFLTQSVVTYLGNKRKLLPFIKDCVTEIITDDPELNTKPTHEIKAFDIFSGSGIVSRMFRAVGYTSYANDLEDYSIPINRTFLETNEAELAYIFEGIPKKLRDYYKSQFVRSVSHESEDPYLDTVQILNSVPSLPNGTKYYSKHYAPQDTANPVIGEERLFFTQENGAFIDAVLDVVFDDSIFSEKARHIILADLFAKMSIHINSPGIMKSYYKKWGGDQGNALTRILGDIQLQRLEFLEEEPRGKAFNTYAEKVFSENPDLKVDVIYADPPYNQHQYGANYHLLTTAFRSRDYQVPDFGKGSVSAIRTDHTKSEFCSKTQIESQFLKFLTSVENHTKFLIVSYNHKGFITPTKMVEILSQMGKHTVSIRSYVHESYKGGRGVTAENPTLEYAFLVKMNTPQTRPDLEAIIDDISRPINSYPTSGWLSLQLK